MSLINDFNNQSVYPNLIGKFGFDAKNVIIKIFTKDYKKIKIPYCYCQQIGDTCRWFWSIEYMPKNIVGKIFYEMLADNGQKFYGDFFIPLKEENNVG